VQEGVGHAIVAASGSYFLMTGPITMSGNQLWLGTRMIITFFPQGLFSCGLSALFDLGDNKTRVDSIDEIPRPIVFPCSSGKGSLVPLTTFIFGIKPTSTFVSELLFGSRFSPSAGGGGVLTAALRRIITLEGTPGLFRRKRYPTGNGPSDIFYHPFLVRPIARKKPSGQSAEPVC